MNLTCPNLLELQGPEASIDVFLKKAESIICVFDRAHLESFNTIESLKLTVKQPNPTTLRLTGEWKMFETMLKQHDVEIKQATQSAALEF